MDERGIISSVEYPFESELYLNDRRFYDTKERFENNSTATQDRSWN